jgi:hypothetical protein
MESADQKLFSKPAYQWYVVILLTTVYVVNFIDRNILAICSGMTAVCGLAQNFTMLLLARSGVAIGARTRQR